MEKITLDQLKENDGSGGKPTWVAAEGIVYDVSQSDKWVVGGHMGIHDGGKDLTRMLNFAPHGKEKLEKFKVVGKLEE